jgi:hypothetical protein
MQSLHSSRLEGGLPVSAIPTQPGILFAENPSTSILVNGAELIGSEYLVSFELFAHSPDLTMLRGSRDSKIPDTLLHPKSI